MSAERWLREKDIFQVAVELRAEERVAYLAKACSGNPELRAGVEALLANVENVETADFLGEEFLKGSPRVIDGCIPVRIPDFGPYEDIVYYGHGGMGVVYRAFDNRLQTHVALKVPLPDLPIPLEHFIREAQKIARLRHPNIIQVHTAGEHEGRPYFTMSLIEGPTSEHYVSDHARDPRVAAWLMIKVARAVQHAHDCKILHRDLKPGNILLGNLPLDGEGNILLDGEREPFVTDFGLATEAVWSAFAAPGAAAPTPATAATRSYQGIVGTISFMAPEQAESPKKVTKRSDVYGLGAVLYALLTGRPPFQGDTLLETLEQVRDRKCKPEPPRTLNPRVDLDLQAVCLKCLNKDPNERYSSAEDLARDLERWLEGRETEARRWRFVERCLRVFPLHPIAAAVTGAAAVLLLATAVTAILVARERRGRLEVETLRSNSYAAYGIASTVLWQLEDWSKPVARIAQDPELRALLKTADSDGLQRYVAGPVNPALRLGSGAPFESWYVEDKDGILLAVSPMNKNIIGHRFSGRDYFKGAMRHAKKGRTGRDAVHISRVFLADEARRIFKFAISAPVRDGDAPNAGVLGVLVVTITTDSTLGLVRLSDQRRIAVLAGQGDTAPPRRDAPPGAPEGYLVLVHPQYKRGDPPRRVNSAQIGDIVQLREGAEFLLQDLEPKRAGDANYQDPFDHNRQLVGFAQVGNTELVVMVQQPYDQAVESHITWAVTLVSGIGVGTFLVLLLAGVVARSLAHRRTDRAEHSGSAPQAV
jgi:serine/threonine protein kinase